MARAFSCILAERQNAVVGPVQILENLLKLPQLFTHRRGGEKFIDRNADGSASRGLGPAHDELAVLIEAAR
jgi:hypothetical protein